MKLLAVFWAVQVIVSREVDDIFFFTSQRWSLIALASYAEYSITSNFYTMFSIICRWELYGGV